MAIRVALPDFALRNPAYAGATVDVWTVDTSLVKTGTRATLYANPTGATTRTNPQTLDSQGKWAQPVYVDRPVVMTVTPVSGSAHDTAVSDLFPRWRGVWASGVTYYPNERVQHPTQKVVYIVNTAHVAGTFATDVATGALEIEMDYSAFAALGSLDAVSVRDFGAVGNGVANDLPAFQAAAATGKCVYVPPGSYNLGTGGATFSAAGQRIFGHREQSIIIDGGSGNTFTFTGNVKGQGASGLTFNSAAKTGGACIYVANGCWRGHFDDMEFVSPWTAMDVRGRNETTLGRIIIQGYRGPRGLLWYGTDDEPSGILRVIFVVGAPATGNNGVGMEVHGRCTSLVADTLEWNAPPGAGNEMQHGIWCHNTMGAAHGMLFFFAEKAQVDFPYGDGFRFDAGTAYSLANLYAQGSKTGNAVHCGAAVQDVAISNPFIRGNFGHGVYFAGADLEITGGAILSNSWPATAPSNLGTKDGVHVAGTARRVSLAGVRIGNAEGSGATQRYGVYGAAGAENITVTGCNLFGNLLDAFRDDTGGAIGNFDAVGNAGVNYSLDGATVIGSETGFRGKLAATIAGGQVTAVAVVDAGYHYDSAPSVFFVDPAGTGSGATATATVANGKVTGVTVTAPGSGYSAGTIAYLRSGQGPVALRALNPAVPDQTIGIRAQGAGQVQVGNERGLALVTGVPASAVNFAVLTGAATGDPPILSANGSDSDIDLRLVPKGTGRVRFGTHTGTADTAISGYIEIKDAGGTVRKLAVIS